MTEPHFRKSWTALVAAYYDDGTTREALTELYYEFIAESRGVARSKGPDIHYQALRLVGGWTKELETVIAGQTNLNEEDVQRIRIERLRQSWSVLREAYRTEDDRVALSELYNEFIVNLRIVARSMSASVVLYRIGWTKELQREIAAHTNQEEESP